MSEDHHADTTAAAAAQTESREGGGGAEGAPKAPPALEAGEGDAYDIPPGVEVAAHGLVYERKPGDPLYRPLKIFTLDPAASLFEGSIAVVNVPWEPLEPGPVGSVFEVDPRDGASGIEYGRVDLDDVALLLNDGRQPSPTDPLFHQQMVYAVSSLVYAAFKAALGRHLSWGFDTAAIRRNRIRLRPYASADRNAYYDESAGEIAFGYFRADPEAAGRTLPRGFVFTSLSHDVIAHEVTHALLDGLRPSFNLPTGPDGRAFHEALADLVAIFQHFSYERVVRNALGKAYGRIEDASMLADVARQFGQTIGKGQALRTAIDIGGDRERRVYREDLPEHALGSVLVSAVFEAFMTVFRRKSARFFRLATGGTGVLPPGEIPEELQRILAEKASRLASQFLSVCIRAVDYCPPVDLDLGEFLRAAITADRDLVPDDKWAYREAWIDAFRDRRIYPRDVDFLSEDALLWRPPDRRIGKIDALTFANLRFQGDPGCPANAGELRRQAGVLGRLVTRAENLDTFGLARAGDPGLRGDAVRRPSVQSIRSSRRVGPDGQIVFDLVAEVTQVREVRDPAGAFEFVGGATVIIGPDGTIRYVVRKSVTNEARVERQRAFMRSPRGQALWVTVGARRVPAAKRFKRLHEQRA